MKTARCLLAPAVALALVVGAVLPAHNAWPGAGSRSPALRLVRITPLTVAGARFLPRERVAVTVTVGRQQRIRRVRADRAGAFRVAFDPLLAVDVCTGKVIVTARGSAGSRAVLTHRCRPPDPRPRR
jgi:hypothetical protein